jgi:polysaccharide export outer membrane protein
VGAPVDPKTYVIGAEDNLMIEVWKEPDLSRAVLVRLDGKISLPLLGEVQAGGLTPETLAGNLATAWSKYVTAPNVMVSVSAVNSKKYFVIGQVARPGSYPLVVPTTILQALSIAGGFQDYANRKNITILRGSKRSRFNYQDFIRGGNESQNILLESGDQIIVP